MSSVMLNWIALVGGILTLLLAAVFFATGQRYSMLRVAMGVCVLVTVGAYALA